MKNRLLTITAKVEIPSGGANGMIIAPCAAGPAGAGGRVYFPTDGGFMVLQVSPAMRQ